MVGTENIWQLIPFFRGIPFFGLLLGHRGAYHTLFVPKSVHLWSFPGHPIRLKRLDEQILEAKKEMFLFKWRVGEVQYLLWWGGKPDGILLFSPCFV